MTRIFNRRSISTEYRDLDVDSKRLAEKNL